MHQPRGCALPRARWLSGTGRSHPALPPGRTWDYSSVRWLLPTVCSPLDECKFCVFFLSFPQTKALTLLLASPEEFTKEARGVSSGGVGGSWLLRESWPPCSGPWAHSREDWESCVEGQGAVAGRQAWRQSLRGGGAGRERGWPWPLRPQFERGCSLVLCFGGPSGRGMPHPEVLCTGPAWTQWESRCLLVPVLAWRGSLCPRTWDCLSCWLWDR